MNKSVVVDVKKYEQSSYSAMLTIAESNGIGTDSGGGTSSAMLNIAE
jgi:hypothetical protein